MGNFFRKLKSSSFGLLYQAQEYLEIADISPLVLLLNMFFCGFSFYVLIWLFPLECCPPQFLSRGTCFWGCQPQVWSVTYSKGSVSHFQGAGVCCFGAGLRVCVPQIAVLQKLAREKSLVQGYSCAWCSEN